MYNNIKVIKRVYYARNKTCILFTQKHSSKCTGTLRIHNDLSAVWKRLHKYLPFLSEGCTEQTVKSTSVSNNISF